LKRSVSLLTTLARMVAPRRGAWIETFEAIRQKTCGYCRTPQGCVD